MTRSLAARIYASASTLLHPFLPLWLHDRRRSGKEDASRLSEKLGHASLLRPSGPLLWLHAASIGEANSSLKLINLLLARYPDSSLLMTTSTVTSATLMADKLPPRAFHQYAPLDAPQIITRFLNHWQPDAVLWMESELWPNQLRALHARHIPVFLLNARLSARSAARWKKMPALARDMLQCFSLIAAQTEKDAERLKTLGAAAIHTPGNLKFDAEPLACNETALAALREKLGNRPCWLAASLHPGEVDAVAGTHRLLREQHPGLITFIVPRHPEKASAMRQTLLSQGIEAALRSENGFDWLSDGTGSAVYIADTLGELGLFYRLCEVVFIGGSLIPHGGQNPLEAARLGGTLLYGPHMFNFLDATASLEAAGAAEPVADARMLAERVHHLLADPTERERRRRAASDWAAHQHAVTERIYCLLTPTLERVLKERPA